MQRGDICTENKCCQWSGLCQRSADACPCVFMVDGSWCGVWLVHESKNHQITVFGKELDVYTSHAILRDRSRWPLADRPTDDRGRPDPPAVRLPSGPRAAPRSGALAALAPLPVSASTTRTINPLRSPRTTRHARGALRTRNCAVLTHARAGLDQSAHESALRRRQL